MIPDWWKTHTVTVEAYQGGGSAGAVFGPAVLVDCRVEDKVQLVRSSSGAEVVSSAVVRCDPGVLVPPESRVTVSGRVTTVISVADHATGGLSTLDHMEIYLK